MFIRRLYYFIWDERWWFPTNYSGVHYGWTDLQNTPGSGIYIPETIHLHWAFLVGVFQVALRLLLIRKTPKSANGQLQSENRQQQLNKDHGMSWKKTERTERDGLNNQILVLKDGEDKYYRVCWDLIYTTTMSTFALTIALSNNWLPHIENVWVGWPKQHVSNAIYLFYIIKAGYYWHDVILFAQDFGHWPVAMRIQVALHHASTIALIYISWMMNVVRFGVIVGLLHDITDPSLRTAKLCVYADRKTIANFLIVVHFCLWILFRIVAFSVFVFYHIMIDVSSLLNEPPFIYYIVVALLVFIVLSNLSYTVGLYHLVDQKTHIFRIVFNKIKNHVHGGTYTRKRN